MRVSIAYFLDISATHTHTHSSSIIMCARRCWFSIKRARALVGTNNKRFLFICILYVRAFLHIHTCGADLMIAAAVHKFTTAKSWALCLLKTRYILFAHIVSSLSFSRARSLFSNSWKTFILYVCPAAEAPWICVLTTKLPRTRFLRVSRKFINSYVMGSLFVVCVFCSQQHMPVCAERDKYCQFDMRFLCYVRFVWAAAALDECLIR